MSEWQPIKTIPKDGQRVLCVCMKAIKGCEERVGEIQVDFWRKEYNGVGKFNSTHWPATHWMLLPSLPKPNTPEQIGE